MMEYLEGDTLSGAIKRDGPFPPARALNVAAQIADALDAAHSHGVIHRDLKPENVFLIERDGVRDFVKVLDFGLAKLTNLDDVATYESRAGAVMGTPYYMSPEQCEGRPGIDHRADVYALGVLLFEMLTGMVPFGGEGFGAIIVKHVTVPPPAARSIVPDLPAALDSILFRSLAKEPGQRFKTMAEFREALLDSERYGATDPAPSRSSPDLAVRVRVAEPMARTVGSPRRASRPEGGLLEDPGLGQSTFRDSAGEVWTRGESGISQPKSRRLRAVLVLGTLAGALLAGVKYRHQTTRFLDGASAAVKGAPEVLVTSGLAPDDGGADVVADTIVDRPDATEGPILVLDPPPASEGPTPVRPRDLRAKARASAPEAPTEPERDDSMAPTER
jgi:serine/threonine-protein kinase